MKRWVAAFCGLLFLAPATAFPAAAGVLHVEAKGIGFAPAKLSAKIGDTIEWTNKDFVTHTATARNGAWDVNLPPNKSGRTVLKKAGGVAYYCRFHPNMTAEIDVAPN
jgi:plastocyanin